MSVLEGKPEEAVDRVKSVRPFVSEKILLLTKLGLQAYLPTLIRNWYNDLIHILYESTRTDFVVGLFSSRPKWSTSL